MIGTILIVILILALLGVFRDGLTAAIGAMYRQVV